MSGFSLDAEVFKLKHVLSCLPFMFQEKATGNLKSHVNRQWAQLQRLSYQAAHSQGYPPGV